MASIGYFAWNISPILNETDAHDLKRMQADLRSYNSSVNLNGTIDVPAGHAFQLVGHRPEVMEFFKYGNLPFDAIVLRGATAGGLACAATSSRVGITQVAKVAEVLTKITFKRPSFFLDNRNRAALRNGLDSLTDSLVRLQIFNCRWTDALRDDLKFFLENDLSIQSPDLCVELAEAGFLEKVSSRKPRKLPKTGAKEINF